MVKLFVVGFPRDMTEIELLELFSVYGAVELLRIITDKDTQVSQGYGFVNMGDQDSANRAIAAMNGASIDDRTISVRIAEDKTAVKPLNTNSGGFKGPNQFSRSPDQPKKKRPRKSF